MSPEELGRQAINVLIDVQAIIRQAYGGDLNGSERGPLVSSSYLASIRDRLRGVETARPPEVCASCVDLRVRLVNIYHLTLTHRDPLESLRAVRAASGPGAPAPAPSSASDIDCELTFDPLGSNG